jgi:hypothetical protein
LKLLHNGQRNCIILNVYESMLQTAENRQQNWASKILLEECGFWEVWLYPRSVILMRLHQYSNEDVTIHMLVNGECVHEVAQVS